jgi:hypothetical protein
MGLKGQRRCWARKSAGAAHRRRDHGAMPAMDTLEIPHGDDGAAQLPGTGRRIEGVMNCDETSRRRID